MNTESVLPIAVELLVKSALISLCAALLARGWRSATAAQRHLLWLVALATVMLLPMTRLVSPRWAIPLQPAKKVTITLPALPPVSVTSVDAVPFAGPRVALPAVRALPDWRKIILGAWLSGTVFLLGYRLFGSWHLQRLLRRSAPLDDPRVRLLLSELSLPRHPEIRFSEECRVPITWGSLRPVMLLPKVALAWNDTWLTAALRHEAAHIRRYDYLTRWFAHVACALYWPNPLVWLLARSLRLAQEQAADDLVLRAGTPADEYATQLVDAARIVATHGLFVWQAVAMACPSTLEDRVRAIVDGRRDRRPLSRLSTAFGSLAIALALTISTAAQLRSASDESPAPSPPIPKAPEAAPAKQHEAVVEIFSHIIEMAPEVKTTPPIPGKVTIWSDPQFQVIWRVMNQKKGVDLLTAPRVTTRSNQQVAVEIVREFRYPTQWEKDSSGWQPKEFATKNVGPRLEVKPRIKEDGVIEMQTRVMVVEFMGFEDLENGKPAPANPDIAHHRYKPVFSERKREETVTLKDGETLMLPDLPETADVKPFEKKSAHRREVLVFITARIIAPAPAKDGPAKETPKNGATETTPAPADATTKAAPPDQNAESVASADGPALSKAKKIIIPKIEFRETTIAEALDFLRAKAVEIDPDKAGVNFVLKPGVREDTKLTMSLRDVPLIEAVRYVAGLANLELRIEPNALVIGPLIVSAEGTTPLVPADDGKGDAPVPPESATEAKGVPVPNHPGYIISPFAPKAGMIDVTGFPAGAKLKCPSSGKVIIVP